MQTEIKVCTTEINNNYNNDSENNIISYKNDFKNNNSYIEMIISQEPLLTDTKIDNKINDFDNNQNNNTFNQDYLPTEINNLLTSSQNIKTDQDNENNEHSYSNYICATDLENDKSKNLKEKYQRNSNDGIYQGNNTDVRKDEIKDKYYNSIKDRVNVPKKIIKGNIKGDYDKYVRNVLKTEKFKKGFVNTSVSYDKSTDIKNRTFDNTNINQSNSKSKEKKENVIEKKVLYNKIISNKINTNNVNRVKNEVLYKSKIDRVDTLLTDSSNKDEYGTSEYKKFLNKNIGGNVKNPLKSTM